MTIEDRARALCETTQTWVTVEGIDNVVRHDDLCCCAPILAVLRAQREDDRERACGAACFECMKGEPVTLAFSGTQFNHGHNEMVRRCGAQNIRAAFAEEEGR